MLLIGFLVLESIILIVHSAPLLRATVSLEALITAVAFLTVMPTVPSPALWSLSGIDSTLKVYVPGFKPETVIMFLMKVIFASG